MKKDKENILITVLFCGFLGVMLVCYLFLPKQSFSEKEKRYLAEQPVISGENLLSGELGEQIEDYMSDHIPGRNFFVGVNAYADLLLGKQTTKDVRLLQNDRIVEAPVTWNQQTVEKNMKAISDFAEHLGREVNLLIVPSAGWASEGAAVRGLDLFGREEYPDEEFIGDIYAMAGEQVRTLDVLGLLRGREDYFYRTDHHWNSRGAYAVYRFCMEALERDYAAENAFVVESVPGFQGSTYTRSGLWMTPGEELELWHSGSALTVTNGESESLHQGVFYRERLSESDKYTVYLDGNHSVVRIENPDRKGSGKLLVIRDSYANSLGCFLAESYETVVLVDLRYYKKPVSELIAQEEFADILVCYSIGNFMTDTNLVWLH